MLDYSPVEHALTYGHSAIRYLLDHGADLHQQRSGDITLLHSADVNGIYGQKDPQSLYSCLASFFRIVLCNMTMHVASDVMFESL
jgi:hypothetical protein